MADKKRYDWEKIKNEYVTTNISTRALAHKHGCAEATLARKASADKWVEQRQQYTSEMSSRVMEKTLEAESSRRAELGTLLYDIAIKKAKAMSEAMDNPDYAVEVESKAISSLTNAYKNLALVDDGMKTDSVIEVVFDSGVNADSEGWCD